ncbi:uncharacterized protein UBRO_06100 [Ustilago bromivora]|uniref:Uncharacterized protein n=1 Tax=Ustilago bromivora TaxID=307758 RepID=A0A1K0HIM2_9BASI|nr:uncharacterized protein UBRO_06100 [Ustilago bromivora]
MRFDLFFICIFWTLQVFLFCKATPPSSSTNFDRVEEALPLPEHVPRESVTTYALPLLGAGGVPIRGGVPLEPFGIATRPRRPTLTHAIPIRQVDPGQSVSAPLYRSGSTSHDGRPPFPYRPLVRPVEPGQYAPVHYSSRTSRIASGRIGGSSPPQVEALWTEYRRRYSEQLPVLFGPNAKQNREEEAEAFQKYKARLAELDHLRNWVLRNLGSSLSQTDAQRLQQKFHPWSPGREIEVHNLAKHYHSFIESEKLLVLEVEKILERLGTTPH